MTGDFHCHFLLVHFLEDLMIDRSRVRPLVRGGSVDLRFVPNRWLFLLLRGAGIYCQENSEQSLSACTWKERALGDM